MNLEHIKSIANSLESEFEKEFFNASIENLNDTKNKLRFNNFAYSMRELIRNVLDRLAPTSSVISCEWFSNETNEKGKVSRGERVKYAVQGGINDSYLSKELNLNLKDIKKSFKDSVSILSKYTHVNTNTFNVNGTDTDQYTESTLSALNDLFILIKALRKKVISTLEEHIEESVVGEALYETIDSIDVLATHHYIEEVYVDKVHIECIDHEYIHILASGHIGVELQWGSNSDLRNDNGALIQQSFPLTCELKSRTNSPEEFEPELATLAVNTSSWHD